MKLATAGIRVSHQDHQAPLQGEHRPISSFVCLRLTRIPLGLVALYASLLVFSVLLMSPKPDVPRFCPAERMTSISGSTRDPSARIADKDQAARLNSLA